LTGTVLQIADESRNPTHQGVQSPLPSVVSCGIPANHSFCQPPLPARYARQASTPLSPLPPTFLPSTLLRDTEQSPDVRDVEQARTVSPSEGSLAQEDEGIVKSSAGQDTSRAVDFDSIYHSQRRRVYALCLRMARNRADAEDLTQEAFLQLFRKIDTFRGDSAFTTWLHRLVVNVVLARLRKKSLPESSLDSDSRFEGETSPSQESLGALDATLTSAIDRLTLELAVAQLPLGFRRVFVLHDVEGYEHTEIAQLLGVSEGTSKSQLHRARGRLRDLLKRGTIRKPNARITPSRRTGSAPDRGQQKLGCGKHGMPVTPARYFEGGSHEQAAFSA
jgi:RNA polymerase sigma-70 factor, ECF subfamily